MVVSDPYRQPEERSAGEGRAELVFALGQGDRSVASTRSAIGTALVALVVASLVAAQGFAGAAALSLAVALVWIGYRWYATKDLVGLILRVEAGELDLLARGSQRLITRISLRDLHDVRLDTRTIQKINEGPALLPAVRYLSSTPGPEVDIARVVLVPAAPREPIELADAYVSHMESIEWLGKIRSFLRAHGWVPEDERDDASQPSGALDDALGDALEAVDEALEGALVEAPADALEGELDPRREGAAPRGS